VGEQPYLKIGLRNPKTLHSRQDLQDTQPGVIISKNSTPRTNMYIFTHTHTNTHTHAALAVPKSLA
jgi:hypothetical protein